MPPETSRPKNLGISRELALVVSAAGVGLVIVVVVVAALAFGLDERSAPIIATLLAVVAMAIPNLVSAIKSIEAADTASRGMAAAEYSVSQNATLAQHVQHLASTCPRDDCPFKSPEAQIRRLGKG